MESITLGSTCPGRSTCCFLVRSQKLRHGKMSRFFCAIECMSRLATRWTFWLHKKDDSSWQEASYHRLGDVSTVCEFWPTFNSVAYFVSEAQFFIFKKGVSPRYEDPVNVDGGCVSFKLDKTRVLATLEDVLCKVMGESLHPNATGVSIAPKGKHYIIKVWLSSCDYNIDDMMMNNTLKSTARFAKHVA